MTQPAAIVQLLESTADAAFAVDARGIVRIWNTAASTLFGWRDADIVGMDWTKVLNGRGALGTSIGREVCDMARLVVFIAQDVHVRRAREHLVERMLAAADRLRALGSDTGRPAPVSPLTAQEKRILRLFAQGNASAAVARALGISPHTLRNHLHHINRKLRTHSRLEAVTHAIKRNLI